MAIVSFKDPRLEAILQRRSAGKGFPPELLESVARKLRLLNAAVVVDELRNPPSNRLKRLQGDLAGRWSIRVNDQFRLVFVWTSGGPADVEFVDYH